MKTNLKQIRVRKGLTQIELAELSGVSQQTISALEREDKSSKLETVIKLSKALQVSMFELVDRH